MPGFDALGRLALGQLPSFAAAPANLQEFDKWPPAPRPPHYAVDWIAFAGSPFAGQFPSDNVFSRWDPAAKPRNFAKDWIAFSGNLSVETLPLDSSFSTFNPPAKPPHLAKDWIAYSGNEFVEAFPQVGIDFSRFEPPAPPRNFAKDWTAYSELGFTIVPVNLIGIEFTPFALGHTAKLWSGQGPQWWAYYFNAPFKPSGRDTHDGGHLRHYHRHPSVYSEEYYDSLRKKIEDDDDLEEIIEEIRRVPNLLIPLTKLMAPVNMPSLVQLPPYRPMPSLTTAPPEFHMATPEEIAMDDEIIIAALLSED
jgi:hypothetical protein